MDKRSTTKTKHCKTCNKAKLMREFGGSVHERSSCSDCRIKTARTKANRRQYADHMMSTLHLTGEDY